MIGRTLFGTGIALIIAAAIRSFFDLMQKSPDDPWVLVFAVGCISASIGFGLRREQLARWSRRLFARLMSLAPPEQ
jgi:threonine/homoserine efflux transporter RhtA